MGLELLTVSEVMDLLRMSRDTVYRLAARGQLPGRKVGRAWRFPKDVIEAYLRQRIGRAQPLPGDRPGGKLADINQEH